MDDSANAIAGVARFRRRGGESGQKCGLFSLLICRVKRFQNNPPCASTHDHGLAIEHFVDKLPKVVLSDTETDRFHKANLKGSSTFASWR